MRGQGTDSIALKNWLGRQNPQFRGGEDLPDLENGEVEIARLTLRMLFIRLRPEFPTTSGLASLALLKDLAFAATTGCGVL